MHQRGKNNNAASGAQECIALLALTGEARALEQHPSEMTVKPYLYADRQLKDKQLMHHEGIWTSVRVGLLALCF